MRYNSLLKERGYKPYLISRQVSIYEKDTKTNKSICVIEKKKDKGFHIVIKILQKIKDDGQNMSDFYKGYLENEANMIKRKFKESR